ncbi:alpha amylase C-terminal domain-containing protein [Actinomadura sp. 9N407]|uniref:alpha amylase C-terminal domain-containing protein n=1 Tax=Actinomadura sp. 9N407 TaxID=3375154 RepID=UPI0037987591
MAFSRGDRGYVVINRDESSGWNRTYRTRLAPGTYCNVIGGAYDPSARTCKASHTITVASDGTFTADVPAMTALALHTGARLG